MIKIIQYKTRQIKLDQIKCFILLTFISFIASAQLTDLARIDYTILPRGNSQVKYSRLRGIVNYPIRLKKKGSYLFLGLDYSNINFFSELPKFINDTEVNEFQLLDLNIGYTAELTNDWRLGIRITPGVSSNLTAKALSIDDVVISTDVIFIKDKSDSKKVAKPFKLILGISYSENRGLPFPIPFINYYRRFHPKWSFAVGIPKSNLQYHFSETQKVKLYAELDGFTSTIQQGFIANSNEIAKTINMSLILSGLQYEYHFSERLQLFARTAYILNQQATLKDEDKNTLRTLNSSNKLFLRTGIRFKI